MCEKSEQICEGQVKGLDLSSILRDAFMAGRGIPTGGKLSDADIAAWAAYDPSETGPFKRISAAIDLVRQS